MTLNEILQDIHAMEEDLLMFERKYGVLTEYGHTERAIFIIDKQGIIRYIDHHDLGDEPDVEELFKVLVDLA